MVRGQFREDSEERTPVGMMRVEALFLAVRRNATETETINFCCQDELQLYMRWYVYVPYVD